MKTERQELTENLKAVENALKVHDERKKNELTVNSVTKEELLKRRLDLQMKISNLRD
jgi:hypothetical protein